MANMLLEARRQLFWVPLSTLSILYNQNVNNWKHSDGETLPFLFLTPLFWSSAVFLSDCSVFALWLTLKPPLHFKKNKWFSVRWFSTEGACSLLKVSGLKNKWRFGSQKEGCFQKASKPWPPLCIYLDPNFTSFLLLAPLGPSPYFLQPQSQRGKERKSHNNAHMDDLKQPQNHYLTFNLDPSVFLPLCLHSKLHSSTNRYLHKFSFTLICWVIVKRKDKIFIEVQLWEKNVRLPFQPNKHIKHNASYFV